ncbi:MAG: HAD family hydrolase [Gammaproteobacteria bacterium]|nr:HAD family hydrolase [Gammaproteobacteria bacterium]
MALAIFDLDNTLLGGDSDHLWGEFLVEKGIVDKDTYRQANDLFYQRYLDGNLDIFEFLAFTLKPLSEHPTAQLVNWREQFLTQKIDPIMLPAAHKLVEQHRQQGDTLIIITATNSFITAPIAQKFGIEHLIATEPECIDGRYTGEVAGIPSFKEGKVQRLDSWLTEHGQDLNGSYFYSDSHNDIPLLKRVDYPVAVDPDSTLEDFAQQQGWKVLSLRQ